MSKRRLVTVLIIALCIIGLMILLLISRSGPKSSPEPPVTPSATADPFQKDRELISQFSKEFAAKFFTYTRPDNPEYFASIKPYMTARFYADNQRLTVEDKNALKFVTPITSEVEKVDVTEITNDRAAAEVKLKSTEDGKSYTQVVLLRWIKEGNLWHVDAAGIRSTTKGDIND